MAQMMHPVDIHTLLYSVFFYILYCSQLPFVSCTFKKPLIRLHHIPMAKTIVFVIPIIRLHHYHGEDYCFCHYYYYFVFFLSKRSSSAKHETCTGMDPKWT